MNSRAPPFDVAAFTHKGAVRGHNEDTIYLAGRLLTGDLDAPFSARLGEDAQLVVVADGMGGHTHGELASRTAVEALSRDGDRLRDEAGCREALVRVNAEIFDLMERRTEAAGMGTTVVGAVVEKSRVLHFNVGDSRAYRHRPGTLRQISQDDVLLAAGGRHRISHALTQCLGGYRSPLPIEPHVGTEPALEPGDGLLLCSDGLTDMVEDEEIAEVLDTTTDPARAAEALFALAMARGGIDNVSVVIVRATQDD